MYGRSPSAADQRGTASSQDLDVGESRVHNFPARRNAALSQDLLVIRRNHDTLVSRSIRFGGGGSQDPKDGRKPINTKCETVRTLPTFREDMAAQGVRW